MTPIVGTDSTPSTPAAPAAKPSPASAIIGLVAILALGVLTWDKFRPFGAHAARAVVTLADGKPLPAVVAPDSVVVLSSAGSTASTVRWDVSDPDIVKVPLPVPGYFAFAVGPKSRTIRGSLLAVSGGTIDEFPIALAVGDLPAPTPTPGPNPTPTPLPEPAGDIDAELRKLAAAYYADSPSAYQAVPGQLSAAVVPDFNAVTSTIGARHSAVANALGARVDALTATLYSPDLAFKDVAAAKAAYAKVAASLQAGLRDAASQPLK